MKKLRWRNITSPGECFHLATKTFPAASSSGLHTHDFAEIFWIESGRCFHHINGQRKTIYEGDLIFICADDAHVLNDIARSRAVLTNLAFSQNAFDDLAQRYPEVWREVYNDKPLPHRIQLTLPQLAELRTAALKLARLPRNRLHFDRFMLNLLAGLQPPEPQPQDTSMPDWLQSACQLIRQPAYFSKGARGFVRAAGRCHEHVSRACRQYLGSTPTACVNRIRAEHAAYQLRMTSRPIADIALDCGIQNLAHFYKIFNDAYGMPPRRYRLKQQTAIS